jgi:hypothetical protein
MHITLDELVCPMLYTKENYVQVYHEDKTKLNQKLTDDDDALAKMNMSAIFCKTIIIAVKNHGYLLVNIIHSGSR